MCEMCQKIMAEAPPEFIEAMELHSAELVAVLTKINEHCNSDLVEEELASVEEKDAPSREDFALILAPYVIGFVMGVANIGEINPFECVRDLNNGARIGHAYRTTRKNAH